MNSKSFVWIRFGNGQPFKVSIKDCLDVADLIEAARNKIGSSERLDHLFLFVSDTDAFKDNQRIGKLIAQVLEENQLAGSDDQHPLLIRKVNVNIESFKEFLLQNISSQKIKSIISKEWKSINWSTLIFVYYQLRSFRLFSATGLLIILEISCYIILYDKSSLVERHFTCSSDNLSQERYWTLISSSLAHSNINHLLCNIASLVANGPFFEALMGSRFALLFFGLSSAVSGLFSLKVHGCPSTGSSGVIFAIKGFLSVLQNFDWPAVSIDSGLYYIATTDYTTDHIAHVAGVLFGSFAGQYFLKK